MVHNDIAWYLSPYDTYYIHLIAAARCHSSCPTNSGCLGPNNSSLCGSCNLIGTFDPCEEDPISEPTVTSATESNTPVILGVVLTVACIVLLVLLGLGVWACVIFTKKWKESRKGSFDISVSHSTGTNSYQLKYFHYRSYIMY